MTTGKELAALPFDEARQCFEEAVRSRFPFKDPDTEFSCVAEDGIRSLSAYRLIMSIIPGGSLGSLYAGETIVHFHWCLTIDLNDIDGGLRFEVRICGLRSFAPVFTSEFLEPALSFLEYLGKSLTRSHCFEHPESRS